MELVNPLQSTDWDEKLLSLKNATFFYTKAWAQVLFESYGYKPIYFAIQKDNKFNAVLPLMEISSVFTGKRGVSLPFTDHCAPLGSDNKYLGELLNATIRFGAAERWKYLEQRAGFTDEFEIPSYCRYYGHTLDLSQGKEQILKGIRKNFLRNINKAKDKNVSCQISHSKKAMDEFYQLNCMTRQSHGLPPQPYKFFKKVYEHIISSKKGIISLASYNEKSIAAAIFFHFNKHVIYKFGASNKNFHHLRPNNLVMFKAIEWYVDNGFSTLDFGRTDIEHNGLDRYKIGWGAVKHQIRYYIYDFKRKKYREEVNGRNAFYEKYFQKLPIPILQLIGRIAYRHMG